MALLCEAMTYFNFDCTRLYHVSTKIFNTLYFDYFQVETETDCFYEAPLTPGHNVPSIQRCQSDCLDDDEWGKILALLPLHIVK